MRLTLILPRWSPARHVRLTAVQVPSAKWRPRRRGGFLKVDQVASKPMSAKTRSTCCVALLSTPARATSLPATRLRSELSSQRLAYAAGVASEIGLRVGDEVHYNIVDQKISPLTATRPGSLYPWCSGLRARQGPLPPPVELVVAFDDFGGAAMPGRRATRSVGRYRVTRQRSLLFFFPPA